MSVWTNMKGTVEIKKSDNVSIKKLIDEVITDEFSLSLETKDAGDNYHHTLDCDMCVDGYGFIAVHEKFFDALKAVRGKMDITCQLRFL